MLAIRLEGEGGRGEDRYADGPGEVRKGSEEAEEEDQEEKAREHGGNLVDLVGPGPAPLWARRQQALTA